MSTNIHIVNSQIPGFIYILRRMSRSHNPSSVDGLKMRGEQQPALVNFLIRSTRHIYMATQHLDSYILLTSKQKFPWLVGRYCSYLLPSQALSTFNLVSTEYRNQGAVSPCTKSSFFRNLVPFEKELSRP